MNPNTKSVLVGVAGIALSACVSAGERIEATIRIDATNVERTIQPRLLGSSNLAFWYGREAFESPLVRQWLAELNPALLRMPGGSWSDHIYWNGNGVRRADGTVDESKVGPDGYPAIDYSAYAPSIIANRKHVPREGWQGNIDMLGMHEFVKAIPGAAPLVIANAGTGRAIDAAEWVRWANLERGYHAAYWEIGNELDGDWEPGHVLPDGTHLTGEMYAKRFAEFAKAMKAVDPRIKTGGATTGVGQESFTKDMLRDAGEYVDFVSIHTYPRTTTLSDSQAFALPAKVVAKEVGQARDWIREFQPNREQEIEIIYSEWNLGNSTEACSSDMFSALWASLFLAEMAKNGVTAANQWDVLTHDTSKAGGFALIYGAENQYIRKAQYYAFQLWNRCTGDRLLATSMSDQESIHALATRTDDTVCVMLLNCDRDREASVTLDLGGFDGAPRGERTELTRREYFWDPIGRKPYWSVGLKPQVVSTGNRFVAEVSPFSIVYLRIPQRDSALDKELAAGPPPLAPAPQSAPELHFLIDREVYAGDWLEGHVVAALPGQPHQPYPVPLEPATLSTDGDASFDRATVRLAEAVGHFRVQPKAPGTLTLKATLGESVATASLVVKPSVPRPVVFWTFEEPALSNTEHFGSDWSLKEDFSRRANKAVARIDLPPGGIVPTAQGNQRALLVVKKLPGADRLRRENIRGAFFDVETGPDFACADPDVGITVVMQTPAMGYWMVLGTVPLKDCGAWQRRQVDVLPTDEKRIQAMSGVYNLWLVLSSSEPVKGSVFIDNIGLMVR